MSHTLPLPARVAATTGYPASSSPANAFDGLAIDLETGLDGRLVLPADPGWDEARPAWNLAVDQRPRPSSLAETVRRRRRRRDAARAHGLRVAAAVHRPQRRAARRPRRHDPAQDLGHARRRRSTPTPHRRASRPARCGSTSRPPPPRTGWPRWPAPRPTSASSATRLGGGLSWLARTHGLAANSVVAAEVVTADGGCAASTRPRARAVLGPARRRRQLRRRHRARVQALPVTEVYAGTLFFPLERAAEVLDAWREWTRRCRTRSPRSAGCCSSRRARHPRACAASSFVVVEVACSSATRRGRRAARAAAALGPVIDTFATIPVAGLPQLHMDPPGPVPGKGDGRCSAS